MNPSYQAGPDSERAAPSLIEAALDYARRGIAVFPLHNPIAGARCSCGAPDCISPGKHPRMSGGFKVATTECEQIQRWWSAWPDANIGVATGAISGLMIVDIDGEDGEESLRRMSVKYGSLPATRTTTTGRGRHRYFKHPGGKVKSKRQFCIDYPHVDSRGDGGYVVAPPSLHVNGTRYANDSSMPPGLASAPSWLIDLIEGTQRNPAWPLGVHRRAYPTRTDALQPSPSGGFDAILGQIGDHPDGQGFHVPIIRAVASYVATHGGTDTDTETLYEVVRARVLDADRTGHDDAYVESMASREHIMPAIEQAIAKFGAPSPRRKSRQIPGVRPYFTSEPVSAAEGSAMLKRAVDGFFRPFS